MHTDAATWRFSRISWPDLSRSAWEFPLMRLVLAFAAVRGMIRRYARCVAMEPHGKLAIAREQLRDLDAVARTRALALVT